MLTLTGPSPATAAAAIPSSTCATGQPASLSAMKIVSSTESRLTVTRRSPAAASVWALRASSAPLVVRAGVLDAVDGGQLGGQALQARAEQRLTAGQPQLAHAQARENPGEPGQFPRK
jgi:hypothetical protein